MTEKITIVHQRYLLHTRKQLPDEDFDHFLQSLSVLVKACQYSEQEEAILRDHVVFGVRDARLRSALLCDGELTLRTAVARCRSLAGKPAVSPNTTKLLKKLKKVDLKSRYENSNVLTTSNNVEEVFVDIESEPVKNEPLECDNFESELDTLYVTERNDPVEKIVCIRNRNSNKKYRCVHCKKKFISKSRLKKHRVLCRKNVNNGKIFSSENNVFQKKFHESNNCGDSISEKEKIQMHILKHHTSAPILLTNIDESVKNTEKYTIIEDNMTKQNDLGSDFYFDKPARMFQCAICSKSYFIKHSLTSHMLTHTGEKPHKCDVCKKSFSTKGHLKEHLLIHNSVKPYQCDVCSKSFLRKWNFNQHLLIHSDDLRYKCNICCKTFAVKDYLKKHYSTHTDKYALIDTMQAEVIKSYENEKSYFCKPCNIGFTTKQFLERHLTLHKEEMSISIADKLNRYQCSSCRKNFSAKRALDVHMLTHTGSRPHQCHICSKRFSQKGSLNLHLLIHSGERPHKCDVCGKCFVSKDYLVNKHMLIHTGERPFCCDSCGKRFAVKCNLNKHMRIHKIEKFYLCDVCQQKFRRKQDLLKHIPCQK